MLTPNGTGWTETILHSFCSGLSRRRCLDGQNPNPGLIMDGAGNLYGTTHSGGPAQWGGVVFQLTPNESRTAWAVTVLYSFCSEQVSSLCVDGQNPAPGLTMDPAGNLYGTTFWGGMGNGVVFQLTANDSQTAWTKTTLYTFSNNSELSPQGSLIIDAAGNLYGTSATGGHGVGTFFMLTPNEDRTAWTLTVPYIFCSQSSCTDGGFPRAGLVMDAAGNLYGAAQVGGANDHGAAFMLTPNQDRTAWTETVLYSFCPQEPCSDGEKPSSGLIMDAAGNLYGTALGGTYPSGPPGYATAFHGHGVAFQLTPNESRTAWTETVLYSFCSNTGDNRCLDGNVPGSGRLLMDGAGNLYGAAVYGGTVPLYPPNQPRGGTVFVLKQN
jgi:hypothetical protein